MWMWTEELSHWAIPLECRVRALLAHLHSIWSRLDTYTHGETHEMKWNWNSRSLSHSLSHWFFLLSLLFLLFRASMAVLPFAMVEEAQVPLSFKNSDEYKSKVFQCAFFTLDTVQWVYLCQCPVSLARAHLLQAHWCARHHSNPLPVRLCRPRDLLLSTQRCAARRPESTRTVMDNEGSSMETPATSTVQCWYEYWSIISNPSVQKGCEAVKQCSFSDERECVSLNQRKTT